jgi:hypothetical protein
MLTRLILVVLQVAVARVAAPFIMQYVPQLGQLRIFAWGIVFAILVWIIGLLGSLILKDIKTPSSATLTLSVVLALVGAALTLVAPVTSFVDSLVKGVDVLYYPLIGAVIGYALRR